jgi:hypothetical protein
MDFLNKKKREEFFFLFFFKPKKEEEFESTVCFKSTRNPNKY